MKRLRLFVSYRREDARHVAGRLADHLSWEAEIGDVFFDKAAIAPGAVFPRRIADALRNASHVLVVIGPAWSSIRLPGANRPRLFDEADPVRREVALALARAAAGEAMLIPVLVDDAAMPQSEELPAELQPLLVHNAYMLRRDGHFTDDLRPLVEHLTGHAPRGADTLLSIVGKLVGGALLGLLAFLAFSFVLQWGLGMDREQLFGGDPATARDRFALLPWAFAVTGAVMLALRRRRWRLPGH